jgi:hypothetical protein
MSLFLLVFEGSKIVMRSFIINFLLFIKIFRIKSVRMRWAGHATCMREMRNACRVLVGSLKGRDRLECMYMGIDRIILRWRLKRYCRRVWAPVIWFTIGTSNVLL